MTLRVGVLALQGAFTEHRDALQAAMADAGVRGDVALVRRPEELAAVDGAVLPGGESTTISKLLDKFRLRDALVERATEEDLPILGTCAGLILLSKSGDAQVERTDTRLLGLMDMATNRNAFGRQRESFEAPVAVDGLEAPLQAVFIRAPAVTRTWGDCRPVAHLDADAVAKATGHTAPRAGAAEAGGGDADGAGARGEGSGYVVAAQQGNRLALAFHPELTADTRLHRRFLDLVDAWR